MEQVLSHRGHCESRWYESFRYWPRLRLFVIEAVPVRQEFRDFVKEPKNLYLYFEGLKRFQAIDTKDPLSYYQIAGK